MLKNSLIGIKAKRDLQATVGELAEAAVNNASHKNARKRHDSKTFGDKAARTFDNLVGSLTKRQTVIFEMDGFQDGGIWWQTISNPLNIAHNNEMLLTQRNTADLEAARKIWGKDTLTGFDVYSPRLMPAVFGPESENMLSLEGRIGVFLHWGTESNRKRLLATRGYTEEQVQEIINSLDEKDIAYAQEVRRIIGQYASEIVAQEKRLTGTEPKLLLSLPIRTKFGIVEGGYFPLSYEHKSGDRNDAFTTVESPDYSTGTTRHGYIEQRAEEVPTGWELRIDFESVLGTKLQEVMHRLTHEDTLHAIGKILRDNELKATVAKHYGNNAFEIIADNVKLVAKGEQAPRDVWERSLGYLRRGVQVATMGYKVGLALNQLSGITQSIVRLGTAAPFSRAARRFADQGISETVDFINVKSDMMKTRTATSNRYLTEQLEQTFQKKLTSKVAQHSYIFMQKMQSVVDHYTWMAGYEHALETVPIKEDQTVEQHDLECVQIADQFVIDSQGSGALKDLSRVQTGSEFHKIWSTFYHFFNTTLNLNMMALGRAKKTGDWGRYVTDFLLLNNVPALITSGLYAGIAQLSGQEDQFKTTKSMLWQILAKDQIAFMMNQVAFVRELSGAFNGFDYNGPAGQRGITEMANLFSQVLDFEADRGLARAAVTFTGIGLHLPGGQAWKTFEGIYDQFQDPKGGFLELVFGKPAKPK
jgi:hypothetical protein